MLQDWKGEINIFGSFFANNSSFSRSSRVKLEVFFSLSKGNDN